MNDLHPKRHVRDGRDASVAIASAGCRSTRALGVQMRSLCAVAFVVSATAATAADFGELRRFVKHSDPYRDCLLAYAARYASTRDPAGDIADAARNACSRERTWWREGLISPKGAAMSAKVADETMGREEPDLRANTIRAVIEARR